jgi:hypothetical protein
MSHLFGDEDDVHEDVEYDNNDIGNNDEDEEEDVLDMEGTTVNIQVGALLMRFCPHDSSMLYPQVRFFVYVHLCSC